MCRPDLTRRLAVAVLASLALGRVTAERPASPVVPVAPHGQDVPRDLPSDTFPEAVSQANLLATVRELVALGPRAGGTPSGDAAAAYLSEAFARLGLPAIVVDDPPIQAYWADRWEARLWPTGERLESAWPYRYAPSIDPPATAPLVSIASRERAEPAQWRDRIVYTRDAPAFVYARLIDAEHRPVALLTSAPHEPEKYEDAAFLGALPAAAPSIPVLALSRRDGDRVAAAASAGGAARLHLIARTRRAPPKTVVATLAGPPEGGYYLVTAHGDSDSGGPGADDNASGVAAVLEVARLLTELSRAHPTLLPFSIRFAIWGEEYHSARSYVGREGSALAGCLGVINIDQAGTGAEREAVYVEGNDVPWNAPLLRQFEGVGSEHLGAPGYWPEFVTTPTQGGTDAYEFLPPRYKGTGKVSREIPSVTVYTAAWNALTRLAQTPGWPGTAGAPGAVLIDYSRFYHSSGDLPENTTEREPQNMVRVVKAVGLTLLRLAQPD
jgi:hypothetical protein